MPSPVEIQISVTIDKPVNGRPIPDRIIREAVLYRIERGHDPPGMTIALVRWRKGKAWSQWQDEDRAWRDLGRLLQASTFTVSATSLRGYRKART